MPTTQNTRDSREKPGGNFPVEAKIAIGMIALGVVALILKAIGVV